MPTAEPSVVSSLERDRVRQVRSIVLVLGKFRDAEVEHLRLTAARDEQIGRLDVAMDDARRVRGIERVGDLLAEIEQIVDRQRTARDARLQRLAFQQLHHHELLAVVLADVVQRADVRMAQRRDDARFAKEAVHRVGHAAGVGREQLERHVTPEPRVLGLIHHAHAAAPSCDTMR